MLGSRAETQTATPNCKLRKPRIKSTGGDQARVGALLDDAAVLQDKNAVGAKHGREPVRDDERGAVLHGALEGLLHQRFALGVERRRRLVEQQHLGVAQDCPRDGDPLALPAGKRDPPFTDQGVVAVREDFA